MTDNSSTQPPCCACCKKEWCFSNLTSYAEKALTTDTRQIIGVLPPGEKQDPCCDVCLCFFCLPIRFIMTIPWCFGATFNSCINCCTKKNKNYLF